MSKLVLLLVVLGVNLDDAAVVVETGTVFNTGTMIGPDMCLTVAHGVALQTNPNPRDGRYDQIETVMGELKDTKVIIHNDGQRSEAIVVVADPVCDLAILKLKKPISTVAVKWAKHAPKKRDPVWMLGAFKGLHGEDSYTQGHVSLPIRSVTFGPGHFERHFLQLTMAVELGASGGPVFNENDEAIGIMCMTGQHGGSSYAIPADEIHKWSNDEVIQSYVLNKPL
jgi:hypothetical protein